MTQNPSSSGYPMTSWTLVAEAANRSSDEARTALNQICKDYQKPIYALICRKWHPTEDALDLTQDYFIRVMEKDILARANRGKGRLRDFLKKACVNFLIDEYRRSLANGGEIAWVSIDVRDAEGCLIFEPADPVTPDQEFEHDWACALLRRVLDRLAGEYVKPEQARVFEVLKVVLTEGRGVVRREKLADKLGMSKGAVHTVSSRLRDRYRKILEEEIAATLDEPSPSRIEEEFGRSSTPSAADF